MTWPSKIVCYCFRNTYALISRNKNFIYPFSKTDSIFINYNISLRQLQGIFIMRFSLSFGLPVSAGISLRYDFNPRWGIGTGVVYTNLSRSFLGDYQEVENGEFTKKLFDTDITNQQHYIGIPVNVFFNIVNTGSWNFHARMDGMGEKLVDNHFLIHDSEGDIHLHQKAQGLQFSAGLGIGVEFKFSPHVGIYFDPTLRYYFNGNQPRSIRTIQPLRMDFEAGVRFSLGK